MTGGPWDALILALALGVPLVAVLLWMRRPVRGTPRDALASRAKASASGLGLLLWPSRAYRKTLIDDAADQGAPPEEDSPPR